MQYGINMKKITLLLINIVIILSSCTKQEDKIKDKIIGSKYYCTRFDQRGPQEVWRFHISDMQIDSNLYQYSIKHNRIYIRDNGKPITFFEVIKIDKYELRCKGADTMPFLLKKGFNN